MPRANPGERITDRLFGKRKAAEQPTFESKLKEEHTKYFENAKKRKAGTYTATETGAAPLAARRREYFAREVNKEYKRRGKEKAARKLSREIA